MNAVAALIDSITTLISRFFADINERKKAAASAAAKVRIAASETEHKLVLTKAEWENLKVRGELHSWKDEFLTVIVSLPILTGFMGALVEIVAPAIGAEIVNAGEKMAAMLNGGNWSYGEIFMVVVSATLGIKLIK